MNHNKLWWATLNSDSPRYREWSTVLGSDGDVRLKGPTELRAELGDEGEHGVYLLDLDQFTENQRATLVDILAAKFQANPAEVLAEIREHGSTFPIRAEDVRVAFSLRAFL